MKELERLILSKSRPVQKEAKHIGVSELDKLIMEALLAEAKELKSYSSQDQQIINKVIGALEPLFPAISFKPESSTTTTVFLQNTGDEVLRQQGVESLPFAEEPFLYYNNNPSLPKIGFTFGGLKFILKKGQGKKTDGGFNPTKFEGDLIEAIANLNNFSADVDDYKNGAPYTTVAIENIENTPLKSGVTSARLATNSPLTPIYKRHGVTSGTPKADILVNDSGVSVKKFEASQLMSAQGPEFAAVIDAAAESLGTAVEGKTLEIITSLMKPKRLGGHFEKAKEEAGGAFDFQRTLQSLLGFKEGDITSERVEEVSHLIGNKILLSESDDLAQLIQKDILSTPEFKMAILKEAVSGRGKFTQKEAVADSILKWSVESPSRANYHILDDDYYNKLMGETKFGIRSRGNQRGLAARVDRVGKQKIEEQLLVESDYHFLHETVESLCEGLFTDLLQKAKGMGTRAWNKAQEIYKAVKSEVVNYVSQFYNYLKNLAKQGLSYLLQFLGMIDDKSELIIANT